MTATLTPLKWVTVINGRKKIATTHFGTQYTLEKMEALGGWSSRVSSGPGTNVTLAAGRSFADARKAAIVDYQNQGGR